MEFTLQNIQFITHTSSSNHLNNGFPSRNHHKMHKPDGNSQEFISILMLTHNAPSYVDLSVRSVKKMTTGVEYELIVLDNASTLETRHLVRQLKNEGMIDKLRILDWNSLFSEGNNLASEMANPKATHYLLLNSDIEIKDHNWLRNLLDRHQRGITSYGVAPNPDRCDGYCLLIDADIYKMHPLDKSHQWWWSVTKQQAMVLNSGFHVCGFFEHDKYIHHFGGASGNAFKNAKGMSVTPEEVKNWFKGKYPEIIYPESTYKTAAAYIRKFINLIKYR